MKNVLLVFGTRPEIIKLAPVYRALENSPDMSVDAYWSGQHVELADGLMDLFGIKVADSGASLEKLPDPVRQVRPDNRRPEPCT